MRIMLIVVAIALLAGCSTLASRGAWVGCQAADTGSTVYALDHGGRELNPVVGAIIGAFGTVGFIAAKTGITLLVLHEYAEVPRDLMATASGLTCAVAAHNAWVTRKLGAEPKTREDVR
jgi:hypothetical protein